MDVIENCGGLLYAPSIGWWWWCVCIVNDIKCKFARGHPIKHSFCLHSTSNKECARFHSSACITISMTISHIWSGVAYSFPSCRKVIEWRFICSRHEPYAQLDHLEKGGVIKWTKEPLESSGVRLPKQTHSHIGQTKRVATFPIHQIFTQTLKDWG